MYLDAMKEINKKKRRILISGAVVLVLLTALWVYRNIDAVLFMVCPEIYAARSFKSTSMDVNDIIWPIFDDKVNAEVDLKIKHISINDKEYPSLKSASVGMEFKSNQNEGEYELELGAGVGTLKLYKAYAYADKDKLVVRCPKIREESLLITWDRLSEILHTDKNFYEYLIVNSGIMSGMENIGKIIQESTFKIVSRKDRKFKMTINYKDNPFPFDECYIYVDDKHRAYRLECDDFSVTLLGEDNLFDNIELKMEDELLGTLDITMKADLKKSEEKLTFKIDELTVEYTGMKRKFYGVFSGKCTSVIQNIEDPSYLEEPLIIY